MVAFTVFFKDNRSLGNRESRPKKRPSPPGNSKTTHPFFFYFFFPIRVTVLFGPKENNGKLKNY